MKGVRAAEANDTTHALSYAGIQHISCPLYVSAYGFKGVTFAILDSLCGCGMNHDVDSIHCLFHRFLITNISYDALEVVMTQILNQTLMIRSVSAYDTNQTGSLFE
jgi:hypothetical protein